MAKTYLNLINDVSKGKIEPVYFIAAPDNYFVNKASALLKEKLFKGSSENYFLKYADETKYNEIIDICTNYSSFFSEKKLVVVKRSEKFSRNLEHIFAYSENPDKDTVLFLAFDIDYVYEKKLDTKEHPFYDFSDLPREFYFQWIQDDFKKRGCIIKEAEVQLFASSPFNNYEIAEREIEKISNYEFDDNENTVTKDILMIFLGFKQSYTPDELMSAIMDKNKKEAMNIISSLLNESGINEIYLLSIISGFYADIICFKQKDFGFKNPYELGSKYRIWKSRVPFVKSLASKLNNDKIPEIFGYLKDTDKKLKSTMTDSKLLMTILVENLINLPV